MNVDTLIERLKNEKGNQELHAKFSLNWINPISPVISTNILPEDICIPNGYKYNPKTECIIGTDTENSTECYSVNYVSHTTKPKKHLFFKKRKCHGR